MTEKQLIAFKHGVADGLFKGKEDNPNNLAYYRQGYDFGLTLYNRYNNLDNNS